VFERYREIEQRRNDEDASNYGFTLIELLIVIIVIGILAAIVIFSLTGVSGQSKTAACTADAKSVEIAADAYQAKFSTWPASVAALTPSYLHTAPLTSNGYTIGIDTVNAVVTVKVGTAAAVNFDDSTGCPAIP
jgi:prepilin-type N-terminal cleavage/methylation domain-containing protein